MSNPEVNLIRHAVQSGLMEVREGLDKAFNAGLEAAAKVCMSVDNYANPMTARDCADAIRALKGEP